MLAHKVAQHYGLKTATVPCILEGRASPCRSQQVIAAQMVTTQGDAEADQKPEVNSEFV